MFRERIKQTMAALAVLALIVVFIVISPGERLFAQNLGQNGNNASDSGAPVTGVAAGTTTQTFTVISAPSTGVATYVYEAYCLTVGSTAVQALLKDGSTTKAILPCVPSSGNSQPIKFTVPIKWTPAVAVTAAASGTPATGIQVYVGGRQAR